MCKCSMYQLLEDFQELECGQMFLNFIFKRRQSGFRVAVKLVVQGRYILLNIEQVIAILVMNG